MPKNPPDDSPRISPYLYYEDAGAALDWLERVFDFQPVVHERMEAPDGHVIHAAMRFEEGFVMMGNPGPDYVCAAKSGHRNSQLYIYVDDVDKHCEHTRAQGGKIETDLEDTFYGDRRYTAEDPEGNHWTFAQRVKDIPPEEWKAPAGTHE